MRMGAMATQRGSKRHRGRRRSRAAPPGRRARPGRGRGLSGGASPRRSMRPAAAASRATTSETIDQPSPASCEGCLRLGAADAGDADALAVCGIQPGVDSAPDRAAAVVEEELTAFEIARPDRLGARRLARRRDVHQPVAKEEARAQMSVTHRRRQQAEIDRAVQQARDHVDGVARHDAEVDGGMAQP